MTMTGRTRYNAPPFGSSYILRSREYRIIEFSDSLIDKFWASQCLLLTFTNDEKITMENWTPTLDLYFCCAWCLTQWLFLYNIVQKVRGLYAGELDLNNRLTPSPYLPYVPPSSCHFQIVIWSHKRHFFDRQFWVGLPQTICKQWAKGFCKILNFWPLHSVRQNVVGFRRGLFTCFLGHAP